MEELFEVLPLDILKRITGKLLGDGNLTIEQGRRPRLRFSHHVKDKAWCEHSRDALAANLSFPPIKYRKVDDRRLKTGYSECFYAQSKTHIALDFLKKQWYDGRKKRLPKELLTKCFSSLTLAWWYMDDGHLKKNRFNEPVKLILSTDSFALDELDFLKYLLFKRFGLSLSTDGQGRLLLYDKYQILTFLRIVRPHLIPCMSRKDINVNAINEMTLSSKRTSIYLPYRLTSPTKEILSALQYLDDLYALVSQSSPAISSDLKLFRCSPSKKYSYQILIPELTWTKLKQCKKSTGLQHSQIVLMCLNMQKKTASK